MFNEVERYDLKGKKILEVNSKIYPFDLGIRNSVAGFDLISDIEKFLELIVLNHLLLNGYKVQVGVFDDKEIDFIATKSGEKKYIQVTYLFSSEEVKKREFGNLEKIPDNYEKIVLSLDELPVGDYKGIKSMNILDFLLEEKI